jgi:hypothetical protein
MLSFAGSSKVKFLPFPTSLSTHILPSCNSTSSLTNARPRPVPSYCFDIEVLGVNLISFPSKLYVICFTFASSATRILASLFFCTFTVFSFFFTTTCALCPDVHHLILRKYFQLYYLKLKNDCYVNFYHNEFTVYAVIVMILSVDIDVYLP